MHHGRIVKTTGDGLLVEFASVVDAMRCAVAWQAAMAERSEPADSRIEWRLGVNLGDIIIDEGGIFGDGVNVAARLDALLRAGRDLRQPDGTRPGEREHRRDKGPVDVTSLLGSPPSSPQGSSIVTHCRQEHGIFVMSVPQNMRADPKAS